MNQVGGTLVGAVVSDHEIVRVLGEGGMGEVYIGVHRVHGTTRAVKVIHDEVRANPSIERRFIREAQVLGGLAHPNIVGVVDYGHLENGWPYLILEYIEGGDLFQLLHAHGAMPLDLGLLVLWQLANVLQYAHERGVVHRDLKPANLLLRERDPRQVKVIDFGLVKLVSAETLTRLTEGFQIMGSPDYMSPEQAEAAVDIREPADVYAWAGIGYAVLSGQSVFGPRPPLAAIYAQARETPPRLSTRIAIPARLDELLYRCLAKDPAERPTAPVLVTETQELLRETSPDRFAETAPAPAAEPPPAAPPPAYIPVATGPLPNSLAGQFATGSGTAPVSDLGLADLIFADPGSRAANRVRDALSRQMLAVVVELADCLGPTDPDIASRRRIIGDIESQLEAVEMDAALLDADIAAAAIDERVALEESRAQLAARTGRLRRLLEAEQRQLALVIDNRRVGAAGPAAALAAELTEMIERARGLDQTT